MFDNTCIVCCAMSGKPYNDNHANFCKLHVQRLSELIMLLNDKYNQIFEEEKSEQTRSEAEHANMLNEINNG